MRSPLYKADQAAKKWVDAHNPVLQAKLRMKRKIEAKKKAMKAAAKTKVFGTCPVCNNPNVPLHTCRTKTDFKMRKAAAARKAKKP